MHQWRVWGLRFGVWGWDAGNPEKKKGSGEGDFGGRGGGGGNTACMVWAEFAEVECRVCGEVAEVEGVSRSRVEREQTVLTGFLMTY